MIKIEHIVEEQIGKQGGESHDEDTVDKTYFWGENFQNEENLSACQCPGNKFKAERSVESGFALSVELGNLCVNLAKHGLLAFIEVHGAFAQEGNSRKDANCLYDHTIAVSSHEKVDEP